MVLKSGNLHASNMKYGIRANAPVDIEVGKATFDNVEIPYSFADGSTGIINQSTITNDPKMKSTVGWTRPKGPPLPVFCPACKSIFASKNYVFAGQFWSLWGCKEPCIICEYPEAVLSEGLFDLAKETAQILSAPDMTFALIKAFEATLHEIASGQYSVEQAAARIKPVSPRLAELLINYAKLGTTLITILAGVVSCSGTMWQIKMQYDQNSATNAQATNPDHLLSMALANLSAYPASSVSMSKEQNPKVADTPRRNPPTGKAPAESEAKKLSQNGTTDAHALRRQAEKTRRKALNPRHRDKPPL